MSAAAKWEVLEAEGGLIDVDELTDRLTAPVFGATRIIANHNLHSLYLLRKNPWLSRFFSIADTTHIDGMPLVWLARLSGFPARTEHRVTYIDWLPRVLGAAHDLFWRVFYLGSNPDVCERGLAAVREAYPNITVVGRHGYFDASSGSTENEAVVREIESFRPDLLLVGMGMPRQERWILENVERLQAKRILPCGAAIDFFSGAVKSPPRWLGRVGLEWAFRLANEPRRLAFRYVVEPLALIGPLAVDVIRRRRRRRHNQSERSS